MTVCLPPEARLHDRAPAVAVANQQKVGWQASPQKPEAADLEPWGALRGFRRLATGAPHLQPEGTPEAVPTAGVLVQAPVARAAQVRAPAGRSARAQPLRALIST